MELLSVNIGKEREIKFAKDSGVTGIYKESASIPVQINALGLEGDEISDKDNHGGVDQAVYVYGGADYAWWSNELGREIAPGTFGDNLTVSDLESAKLNIGDRLHFKDVILEVTSPRIPCVTLATRMGDPQFVKKFRKAGRPGVYCRVIQTGEISAGESVSLQPLAGENIFSIPEMFEGYYEQNFDGPYLERALAAPIAIRARDYLQGELDKLRTQENAD